MYLSSPEKLNQGDIYVCEYVCVCVWGAVYYKELAHAVMIAERSCDLLSAS